jgi:hypothetical protein
MKLLLIRLFNNFISTLIYHLILLSIKYYHEYQNLYLVLLQFNSNVLFLCHNMFRIESGGALEIDYFFVEIRCETIYLCVLIWSRYPDGLLQRV